MFSLLEMVSFFIIHLNSISRQWKTTHQAVQQVLGLQLQGENSQP